MHTRGGFLRAVKSGNIEKVREYLAIEKKRESFLGYTKEEFSGGSALHIAVREGHKEIVKLLANAGINLNRHSGNYYYDTPLVVAIYSADAFFMAELLVDLKCDISCRNYQGYDAIYYAVLKKNTAIVDMLLSHGAEIDRRYSHAGYKSLLHFAAENNDSDMLAFLIEKKADLYQHDKDGNTPLALARKVSDKPIIRMLEEAEKNNPQNISELPASPAGNPIETQFDNPWEITGEKIITYTMKYNGGKLSQIFNFETQERITIVSVPTNKADPAPVIEAFDVISATAIDKAEQAYEKSGGNRDDIVKIHLVKKE